MGPGLKRPITLSLSEEAIAILDQQGCPSRSSAAELMILSAPAPMKIVAVDSTSELQRGCPHPKADEVKNTWGTQCGLCKKRLR